MADPTDAEILSAVKTAILTRLQGKSPKGIKTSDIEIDLNSMSMQDLRDMERDYTMRVNQTGGMWNLTEFADAN